MITEGSSVWVEIHRPLFTDWSKFSLVLVRMRKSTIELIAMLQNGISALSTFLYLGDLPSCGKIQLAQTLYIFHERPRKKLFGI